MSAFQDLTGQQFGRLTVVSRAKNDKSNHARWHCTCNCGGKKIVSAYDLKSSHTQSCGCYRRETTRAKRLTHGARSHNRERLLGTYNTWANLIQRCTNPKDKEYVNYGERGITVCDRWLKFENFLEDMGKKPKGLSIDRIDNNGNYELANCRWATAIEQANNQRTNRLIEFQGRTQTMSQWARECGFKYYNLQDRLKSGWSVERALTTPLKH